MSEGGYDATAITEQAKRLAEVRRRGLSTIDLLEAAMLSWAGEPKKLRNHLIEYHDLTRSAIRQLAEDTSLSFPKRNETEAGYQDVLDLAESIALRYGQPLDPAVFVLVALAAQGGRIFAGNRLERSNANVELQSVRNLLENGRSPEEVVSLIDEFLSDNERDAEPKYDINGEVKSDAARETREVVAGGGNGDGESKTPNLDKFSRNITNLAREGKLPPVIGREKEIWELAERLGASVKPNVAILGEPGIGKTAIVEGLAQWIVSGVVPPHLRDKQLIELDLGSLKAGASMVGDYEQRVKDCLKEIKEQGNVILFIDEMHMMSPPGGIQGVNDLGNLLKPPLARGEIQFIGATTFVEFRKYIANDAALARRLQPQMVEELDQKKTLEALDAWVARLEKKHGVHYAPGTKKFAYQLAGRYWTDRNHPDKDIDILDLAGAKARVDLYRNAPEDIQKMAAERLEVQRGGIFATEPVEREEFFRREHELTTKIDTRMAEWAGVLDLKTPLVDNDRIAHATHTCTGIPVSKLTENETSRLMRMASVLRQDVKGQDEAVEIVSEKVQANKAGLGDPNRPIGSFIFLGPTGVGKTEIARRLNQFMFDNDDLIRIDMSEYMEKHTASRLVGAPPGYIGYDQGGQLTEAVKQRPYSVILFDEIEKAHPDVFNVMLQILDDGRLTDGQGRTVNFKNTLIIMTSNIPIDGKKSASGVIQGFRMPAREDAKAATPTKGGKKTEDQKKAEEDRLRQVLIDAGLRPEFVNRIDAVAAFNSLTEKNIRDIVDVQFRQRNKLFKKEKKPTFEPTAATRDHLAAEGWHPKFGARPLKRKIDQVVESPEIVKGMLAGKFKASDRIIIDWNEKDEYSFTPKQRAVRRRVKVASTVAEQNVVGRNAKAPAGAGLA